MEVMEYMEATDTGVNEEVPMLKLMPTMDMVVVMVDMEAMVDMVDTDTDVNEDLLMLTMDMVVMVDTVVDMEVMVDTVMAVNLTSFHFITPRRNYTTSFQHTKDYIPTAEFEPLHCT